MPSLSFDLATGRGTTSLSLPRLADDPEPANPSAIGRKMQRRKRNKEEKEEEGRRKEDGPHSALVHEAKPAFVSPSRLTDPSPGRPS